MNQTSLKIDRFDLNVCNDWIANIDCKYVCLYFLTKFHHITSEILFKLQQKNPNVKFVIHVSSSSNVETISVRLRDQQSPDAVIYFGTSCLCLSKFSLNLPVLFMNLSQGELLTEIFADSYLVFVYR